MGLASKAVVDTGAVALLFPFAHLGHYLWALYVAPVAIVVISIVKTTLSERREAREEEKDSKG
jgi:heme exporter protein D